MSDNSPSRVDVPNLIAHIREQISLRTEPEFTQAAPQITENLRSISDELDALRAQAEAGEPQPLSTGLRGRIGLSLKRRLYRLLWWHGHQMRAVIGLITRWTAEERKVIDTLLQDPPSQRIRDVQQAVLECQNRLRQLEAAQLRLQASEIERNVRQSVQQVDQFAGRLGIETAQRTQLAERLSTLAQRVEGESSLVGQLAGRLADFERSVNETTAVLAQRLDGGSLQAQQLAGRLSELGIFTHQTRASLSIQDRRLSLFMEEFRKQMPNPMPQEPLQKAANEHAQHRFDSLYAAFEDIFRGSREEIKARQAIYLPLLKEHGVGSPSMPLLDLGCGRGEFLELLSEHGIEARGVDLNEEMVERCQSRGLPVTHGDALPFLRTLPDACLGALTAFHMVEHMPFDVVLNLVDESLRVLKQGGILILETPNPANVLVGSHTFHLDPTHLKPLPSPMLRFFVEGRGFCNVYVQELHPYPEVVRLPEDGSGVATRINDFLYGPQDYAVIGRKP